ncbi:Eukaryotic translation initiation factor 3 subunit A [Eumeta japonica]|uniref:Eukaryotic translation initiation factor 3 subunit A n=1 Tax=Eumeta variegata TaxID=151549 RepID=A0A4C1SYV2_EUMVA|nr:Eukaryotic translation initiation factor 3 subunit A [Eumeta japonica]
MQIRIDHQKRCIYFGTDLTESQREDHPDGPNLQSMPSEQIRSQLVNMSSVLHRAVSIVYPNRERDQRAKMRTQMVQHYHEIKNREHQRILQRQKIIEDRKEFIEKQNNAREEEEARRLEDEARKAKLAEQKRLEQENEQRERKRHQNEIQAIKEKSLKEKVQQISQTAHGKKMLEKLDAESIKKLDADQIAAKESEELQRERKELQNKLKSQEKKIDYFERCKRMKEIPLFEKYLSEKMVKDKEFWEAQEAARIENAIAERKDAVIQQERLKRMHPDRDIFLDKLKKERAPVYAEKPKQFEIALAEERKKRLAKRVELRREQRRQQWLREKDEERMRKEEEIRRAKEEEERAIAEARRKEREAEEEKRRIQYEKQRAKEEEAERRIQEERERLAREVAAEREREKPTEKPWRPRGGERDTGREERGVDSSDWRRGTYSVRERERPNERRETGEAANDSSSWRVRREQEPAPARSAAGTGAGAREDKWRRGGGTADDERAGRGNDNRQRGGERDERPRGGDRDERPRAGDRDDRPRGASNWRDAARPSDRDNRRQAIDVIVLLSVEKTQEIGVQNALLLVKRNPNGKPNKIKFLLEIFQSKLIEALDVCSPVMLKSRLLEYDGYARRLGKTNSCVDNFHLLKPLPQNSYRGKCNGFDFQSRVLEEVNLVAPKMEFKVGKRSNIKYFIT